MNGIAKFTFVTIHTVRAVRECDSIFVQYSALVRQAQVPFGGILASFAARLSVRCVASCGFPLGRPNFHAFDITVAMLNVRSIDSPLDKFNVMTLVVQANKLADRRLQGPFAFQSTKLRKNTLTAWPTPTFMPSLQDLTYVVADLTWSYGDRR